MSTFDLYHRLLGVKVSAIGRSAIFDCRREERHLASTKEAVHKQPTSRPQRADDVDGN